MNRAVPLQLLVRKAGKWMAMERGMRRRRRGRLTRGLGSGGMRPVGGIGL
jgi:hypothetical protein